MCQAYSFSNEVKDLGNLLWKVNSSLLPRKAFFFSLSHAQTFLWMG